MRNNPYHIYSGRVIYVYSHPDKVHTDYIKITDRLLTLTEKEIEALKRYPDTLEACDGVELPKGAKVERVWNGTFIDPGSGERYLINARDIYDHLENAGVTSKFFHEGDTDKWFKATMEDVDKAIHEIQKNLANGNVNKETRKIHFRPEQKKAIEDTTHYLEKEGRRFLWNAKMRFGKTLSALEVARRRGYKYTLIVTHRPVVNDGWKKDFDIIFKDSGYEYGAIADKNAKDSGYFENLVNNVKSGKKKGLVFFVSIQYLRLSHLVKPSEAKNKSYKENKEKTAILNFPWDFVVIDEAHEGTQSERGVEVMRYLRLNVPDKGEKQPALSTGIDAISRKKENEETPTPLKDEKIMAEKKLPVSPRSWGKLHSDEDPITLSLSGTPFNLYTEFSPKEIYTWDYVKEQTAKENWSRTHFDDPNPYDVLPRMHIFNLDIEETIGKRIVEPGDIETRVNSEKKITDEELDEEYTGFNFSRLFKVWDKSLCNKHGKDASFIGKFVHEEELIEFFYALAKETKEGSNFPFSTPEFRKAFRHTFWLIPGVSEGKALQELLEKPEWTLRGKPTVNPYKRNFRVINAAGSEQEDFTDEALRDVEDHIMLTKAKMPKGPWDDKPFNQLSKKDKERYQNYQEKLSDWKDKYTITLSCGKLTTGVSVPEWTAVFYMKGNDATSASSYMQTIFRTQTPAIVDGKQKTDCYVFDFSPTRSLKVFSDAVRLYMASERGNDRSEKYTREDQKEEMKKWLDVMPLQAINVAKPGNEETSMVEYDADKLFSQLDEKLINRVVRSGYADNSIYDSVAIMEISDEAARRLGEISERVRGDKTSTVDAGTIQTGPNTPGKPSGRQRDLADKAVGKSDKELSSEEIEAKKAVDAYNRQRRERMKTMRAISIRIPLLMYGAEISNEKELNIENFTQLVDDESWVEFMPKYLTKEDFDMVRDCYDPVRFRGAAVKIREYAEEADKLSKTERVKEIARIFSFFHNPDKETVLTPWRVVNMHMSQTLGGYNFFDDEFTEPRKGEPEFVNQGEVTMDTLATDKSKSSEVRNRELDKRHILEINSKTGLYPLYVAYSLFRDRKDIYESAEVADRTKKDDDDIWEETLRDNLFVVCKTPMAKAITRRTLAGFMTSKENGVDTGRPLQVNAVCPEWELPKKELVKRNILKNPESIEISENEKSTSDLVTTLRYDSSRFEKDVVTPEWWERGGREAGKRDETVDIKLDKLSNKNMINFNAVVGNPPYMEVDGGGGSSSKPIYDKFVEAAMNLKSSYNSMIMPARWMSGGKGLDSFREKMLSNHHIVVLHDYMESSYIFPNVSIEGGICYFLINPYIEKECTYFSHTTKDVVKSERFLDEDNSEVVIREINALSIIEKIKRFNLNKFSEIVFPRNPFNISGNEPYVSQISQPNGWKILGRFDNQRSYRYLPSTFIPSKNENIAKKWKIFISKADGAAGQLGNPIPARIIGKAVIGDNKTLCTETFLAIGPFEEKSTCENIAKYCATKFFRFLVGVRKLKNMTRMTYSFVPLEDFTSNNKDIDWSKSIAEIDKDLYKKYGLEKNEIDFIESMIKPME